MEKTRGHFLTTSGKIEASKKGQSFELVNWAVGSASLLKKKRQTEREMSGAQKKKEKGTLRRAY